MHVVVYLFTMLHIKFIEFSFNYTIYIAMIKIFSIENNIKKNERSWKPRNWLRHLVWSMWDFLIYQTVAHFCATDEMHIDCQVQACKHENVPE